MRNDFDLREQVSRIRPGSGFRTFVVRDSLQAGVLRLEPGMEDTQEPHDADEIYHVVSGDGFLRIGRRDHRAGPGKVFFVGKGVEHRFHGNTKTLTVLYFFGG